MLFNNLTTARDRLEYTCDTHFPYGFFMNCTVFGTWVSGNARGVAFFYYIRFQFPVSHEFICRNIQRGRAGDNNWTAVTGNFHGKLMQNSVLYV